MKVSEARNDVRVGGRNLFTRLTLGVILVVHSKAVFDIGMSNVVGELQEWRALWTHTVAQSKGLGCSGHCVLSAVPEAIVL